MSKYQFERNKRADEKLYLLLESMPEFVSDFFVSVQTRTSALTRLNYAHDLNTFFDFLLTKFDFAKSIAQITLKDVERISARHIERFMAYLENYVKNGVRRANSNCAKARKLSAIKSLFKYLYKRDLIETDVSAKIDTPKSIEKPIIRMNGKEVSDLLTEMSTDSITLTGKEYCWYGKTKLRDIAIITLMLGTGIRVSECVGLDIADIDLTNNAFRVIRKGGATSILYFNGEVKSALNDYLKYSRAEIVKDSPTPALFVSLRKSRICVRAVENLVKKYTQSVNPLKNITPHKLRSTFGTELYNSVQDIYAVAEILGHKDVNTTKKHYAAISETIKKDAISRHKILKSEED